MIKKVFVSLPMRDKTFEQIRAQMNIIFNLVKKNYQYTGDEFELIDSIIQEEPDADISSVGSWYLGKSIQSLSEADIAVFHSQWRTARGCILEHMICALYNIPYFDISIDYKDLIDANENDYTRDWNMAGEINAELSKRVAEAEGLSENDILGNDDAEDALGNSRDDADNLVDSDPDLNPYAQHSEIDIAIMDEFDENGKLVNSDILEPGEYNADIRP